LEVILQSSMTVGGPPLLSPSDFDTEPPSNIDDDKLMEDDALPKPKDEFT
jgi:hypothetical protein